jgi:hypothetical protein
MTPGPRPSRALPISVLRGVLLSAAFAAFAACASGGTPPAQPASSAAVPPPAPAAAPAEDARAALDVYLTRLAAYGWGGTVWTHTPGSEPVARA